MKFKNHRAMHFAAVRVKLGLSQQQLADKLGVSRSAIGMFETGRRMLPAAALLRLVELELKLADPERPANQPFSQDL